MYLRFYICTKTISIRTRTRDKTFSDNRIHSRALGIGAAIQYLHVLTHCYLPKKEYNCRKTNRRIRIWPETWAQLFPNRRQQRGVIYIYIRIMGRKGIQERKQTVGFEFGPKPALKYSRIDGSLEAFHNVGQLGYPPPPQPAHSPLCLPRCLRLRVRAHHIHLSSCMVRVRVCFTTTPLVHH